MCFLKQIKRSPQKNCWADKLSPGAAVSPLFSDTADGAEETAQIDLSSENVLLVLIACVSSTVLQCRRGTFFGQVL